MIRHCKVMNKNKALPSFSSKLTMVDIRLNLKKECMNTSELYESHEYECSSNG